MVKTSIAVVALMLATIFGAPAVWAQDDAMPMDPAVAQAAPVPHVTPADVLKMIDEKRADIAVVDTQPVDGFVAWHITGAINYPWVMKIKRFPIDLPRNKTLIFYGSCPNDTADIVVKLAEFGYANVRIMDGGLQKWLELKYPSTGTESSPVPEPSVSQMTAAPAKNDKPVTAAK